MLFGKFCFHMIQKIDKFLVNMVLPQHSYLECTLVVSNTENMKHAKKTYKIWPLQCECASRYIFIMITLLYYSLLTWNHSVDFKRLQVLTCGSYGGEFHQKSAQTLKILPIFYLDAKQIKSLWVLLSQKYADNYFRRSITYLKLGPQR